MASWLSRSESCVSDESEPMVGGSFDKALSTRFRFIKFWSVPMLCGRVDSRLCCRSRSVSDRQPPMPWGTAERLLCDTLRTTSPVSRPILSGSVTSLLRESTRRRRDSISQRTGGSCDRSLSCRWTCRILVQTMRPPDIMGGRALSMLCPRFTLVSAVSSATRLFTAERRLCSRLRSVRPVMSATCDGKSTSVLCCSCSTLRLTRPVTLSDTSRSWLLDRFSSVRYVMYSTSMGNVSMPSPDRSSARFTRAWRRLLKKEMTACVPRAAVSTGGERV
mmetsp:Transcript_5841/g.12927  ORF Transcript_5841/g.12927 Transcript_5841/m.12927 type:complete len:276 (-) Transcript_5841:1471-2298(-)